MAFELLDKVDLFQKDDKIIMIPRNNPINAHRIAGIIKDPGMTMEDFKKYYNYSRAMYRPLYKFIDNYPSLHKSIPNFDRHRHYRYAPQESRICVVYYSHQDKPLLLDYKDDSNR